MEGLHAEANEILRLSSFRPSVAVLACREFGEGVDLLDSVEEVGGLFLGRCGEVDVAVLVRSIEREGSEAGQTGPAGQVRLLGLLGVKTLLIEGVGRGVGMLPSNRDLFFVTDHLNLTGSNPLIGANVDDLGPRFPDMSEAYDPSLRAIAISAAQGLRIPHREGVFAEVARERWAELRVLEGSAPEEEVALVHRAGAEWVGVGLVPEVIVARHMGVRVLGMARHPYDENSGASMAPLFREIVKEL